MKNRNRKYFAIKKILKLAEIQKKSGCIEFPHFGAGYPDACCIDGYLWDLDSEEDEGFTQGGNDPCPVCNTRSYLRDMINDDASPDDTLAHIRFIFSKYGAVKTA